MALVQGEELGVYLGLHFDAGELVRANQALELASGVVEDHLGRTLASARQTETVADGSSTLVLRRWPITEVHSVTRDGVLLAANAYHWEPHGVVGLSGGRWMDEVVVDYTAGYVEIPQSIKLAVLVLGSAMFERAHPQTFGTDPEGSATFARKITPSADKEWRKLVDRYRSPAVA